MTVHPLKRAAAKYGNPTRHRLAELLAKHDALAAEIVALSAPRAERETAAAALPAALAAHARALQDADLGDTDGAALDGARAEVHRLRKIVSDTPDHSGEIARLNAEVVQLGEAIEAERRNVIFAEVARLTARYQRASKEALAAEAALEGLAEYGRGLADQSAGGAIVSACIGARRLANDLDENATRRAALNGVLDQVRRVYAAFPAVLAADPSAAPEPLEAAIALLPSRVEEQGEADVAAA